MIGDKQLLDVYLGKIQIANIKTIEDQLYWSYSENWQKTGFPISPHMNYPGFQARIAIQFGVMSDKFYVDIDVGDVV
ncbi:HipA N-terminal domain-containing protein [Legionella gresilensis]|uniref:HipA N-terminal domain-containing protein n=1 Tax=Legionella gresilensis TaxID=91823 RepID=UPI001F5F4EF3|nr:hypothetical protein [Legionella gresilensis]